MKNGLDAMFEATLNGPPRGIDEFRCTIPNRYPSHTKTNDMQGHYVKARDVDHASKIMSERFPYEKFFHIELWKSWNRDGEQTSHRRLR